MFPLQSRRARLLSPGVQSLYRKAVLPTASVRIARSRLYASLQNTPESGKNEKSEPLSKDSSKHAPADHGKKPAKPTSGKLTMARAVDLTEQYWRQMAYPKGDTRIVRNYPTLEHAIDAMNAARLVLRRVEECIRSIHEDVDLALQILWKKLGSPEGAQAKFLSRSQDSEHNKVQFVGSLVHSLAKRDLVTLDELIRLRKELGIAPTAPIVPQAITEGANMMPEEVHVSLKHAWTWLLLEIAAAKKNGPNATTSNNMLRDGSSPPASDDGEVQRLTKALGVLKGAMGADKGVASTSTAKDKKKALTKDSSKVVTPKQPTTKPSKNGEIKTETAPADPSRQHENLGTAKQSAFRELRDAWDKSKDQASNTLESPTVVKELGKPYSIHYVKASDLELQPIEKPQPPVPGVQYGLDRVLFNPGVYQLQCPRTQVYNFDPYLARIMPIEEFDFTALKQYVTSSKDQTLIQMASGLGKKYTGSTSSMTASLAHFHFLISGWRTITTTSLTRETPIESFNFTRIMRGPAAAFLHYKDGTYAIDADKEFDKATILSMLGKSVEKLLTLPKEEFENYHRDRSHLLSESTREDPEAFHYTTLGDFLMRSQLDAHNPRLPGTGMYDLKTRAVLSIRMDSSDIKSGLGYEIRHRFGEFESFEREYLDMIRSAFLKYSMQVRMGRMDGIFVAFHNTERIFGFQYIPLEEMDYTIHGTTDRQLGDEEFKLSVNLLNKVLDKATARFPGKSLRLHFETRPSETPFMYIFAKPVNDAEIDEVQEANKAAVEKFEKEIMSLDPVPEPAPEDDDRVIEDLDLVIEDDEDVSSLEGPEGLGQEMWADMMDRVEEAMEDDARGIATVREAIERALEESGLLVNLSAEKAKAQIEALLSAISSSDLRAAAESIQTTGVMEQGIVSPDGRVETAEEAEVSEVESEPVSLTNSKDKATESATAKETAELSLKDIILGLASRAQSSITAADPFARDTDKDAKPRETLRIRKFEKVLSEMLSGSKESNDGKSAPAEIEANMKQADIISNTKSSGSSRAESQDKDGGELLGMVLTVRNMLGPRVVERVYGKPSDWNLAYSIEEMSQSSAEKIYNQVRERRRKTFETKSDAEEQSSHYKGFLERLRKVSQEGLKYRQAQDELERKNPVYIFGKQEGLDYREVFGDTPSVQKKDGDEGAGETKNNNEKEKKEEKTERAADEDVNRGFVDRP
ncbi:hypothetical protein MCOR25_001892 [Pyricularia grisea]|uniref:Uncharacterized protein n=1 Tax=Pyricularia grisea TaxID=148305 RepID=A0A6P8BH88_PYRGI|nr:uncharacterized protein PgNI_01967 [Pyricularia grisea]KAI6379761.1 hypothetical protein MCOR25_001892 [Pyricularia grisea]TLD16246.1 hypothetical protein PgNI_01967 [Pyricularia grisea]